MLKIYIHNVLIVLVSLLGTTQASFCLCMVYQHGRLAIIIQHNIMYVQLSFLSQPLASEKSVCMHTTIAYLVQLVWILSTNSIRVLHKHCAWHVRQVIVKLKPMWFSYFLKTSCILQKLPSRFIVMFLWVQNKHRRKQWQGMLTHQPQKFFFPNNLMGWFSCSLENHLK